MRPRPLRFAILGSRGYPSTYGGFETLVRRLAPFLAEWGADVSVYGRGAGIRCLGTSVDGVRVVTTPGIDRPSTGTLSHGLTAVAHAARVGYDAVLVLNVAHGYWLPILRAAGVPTLVNVDGLEWERDKWNSVGKAVFRGSARLVARFADRIVADSEAISRYWEGAYGVSPVFIPYGADVLETGSADLLTGLGLKPGSYLLVVARLVPENNVELFLNAVSHLDSRYPVVVVGSAAARHPVEEALRRLQSTRQDFFWLGHVHDQRLLDQLWRHCALYVHGHSVGGTNPALLQALGAGAPTIALDTVYNREVLGPQWPVYRAGCPADLAELIDRLMASPERRSALSRLGQETVRLRYRWDDVLKTYTAALEDLAAGAALRLAAR